MASLSGDAIAMPPSSVVFAALAVLLVVGVPVAWAVSRRRAVGPATAGPTAGTDERRPVDHREVPGLARGSAGDGATREWLRRLHAVGMEGRAFSQGAVVAGSPHAGVVARAVATLDRIETQPRYTPRRPHLLPQLMRTVSDPEASGKAIAAIAGQDPVLAGNLLRIASSALYRGQSRPVEDLAHAVAMVGTDGLRQLIAVALVQPVMGGGGSGPFRQLADLVWEHTQLSAAAAADHAQLVERGDAFSAQLAGLTHGLGAAAVARVARDQYGRQPALAPDAGVVEALLDAWATPTALRIATRWELSAPVHQALEDQQQETPRTALGRSLRFGRLAGALVVLCRHGRMDEAEALRTLAPSGAGEATATIWKRLRRGVEDPAA
jgi:HD-like signal output (HDOD) protein